MNEAPSTKPYVPTDANATQEAAAAQTPSDATPATPAPSVSDAAATSTAAAPSPEATATVPAANPVTPAATSPSAPVTATTPPSQASVTPGPAADATNAASATSSTPPTEPSEAHVLVVEDNVPNFVLIARMLAFMGVQRCEWKTSGWQVVQFADTLPRVDLILMDIRLPYEDGYQALQKLRANARLKDTVVCAVTAEASEDQMRRAKKAGFNGFLGKPLDPDKFPSQIRRLLAREEVWEWK